jgi:hypothetical protein
MLIEMLSRRPVTSSKMEPQFSKMEPGLHFRVRGHRSRSWLYAAGPESDVTDGTYVTNGNPKTADKPTNTEYLPPKLVTPNLNWRR